jgi:hypothetical protein
VLLELAVGRRQLHGFLLGLDDLVRQLPDPRVDGLELARPHVDLGQARGDFVDSLVRLRRGGLHLLE